VLCSLNKRHVEQAGQPAAALDLSTGPVGVVRSGLLRVQPVVPLVDTPDLVLLVAAGRGHSPKVAAEHFRMPREHHVEDVVQGGPHRSPMAEEQRSGNPCDANCDSLATRIATPHASAAGGTQPHETTEPAATIQVAAGFAGIAQVAGTGGVGSTGFEPVTSTV